MLGETVGDINRPGLTLMGGVKPLREDMQEERDEEGKQKHMQRALQYNNVQVARLISQLPEMSSTHTVGVILTRNMLYPLLLSKEEK